MEPQLFATVPSSVQHIKGGRLIALGVSTTQRVPALPDVPTVAESGVPGFAAFDWQGLFLPAATPQPIVDRLQRETARALGLPDVKERFTSLGMDAVGSTPEAFAAFVAAEFAKWEKVVRASGARAD